MSCGVTTVKRELPSVTSLEPLPPGVPGTRLVTEADDPMALTARRDCDAHGALVRGLAEYLETLSIDNDGTALRFKSVAQDFADVEDPHLFPRAAVYSMSLGNYDASNLTPVIRSRAKVYVMGEEAVYLLKASELRLDITVEVWATDKDARQALVAMLEDAFCPVDWKYGARLELPHYYNTRANYQLTGVTYLDSDTEVARRKRGAMVTLSAQVPVLRPIALPTARPRTEVTVSEDC